MADIVLTHDGAEISVPLETVQAAIEKTGLKVMSGKELESNYLDRETLGKDYMLTTALDSRFKNWIAKAEAPEDETIIAKVLDKHGKKGPDIEEAKKTWETASLVPLQTKYDSLTTRLVGSEIRAETSEHFDEQYTKLAPNGAPSYMENVLRGDFEYSDEYGYTVALQNGVPIPSSNPTASRPYRSAHEHVGVLAESPAWSDYLKAPPKGGGGSGRPGDKLNMGGGKSIENMSESELAAGIRDKSITYDRNGDLHIVT